MTVDRLAFDKFGVAGFAGGDVEGTVAGARYPGGGPIGGAGCLFAEICEGGAEEGGTGVRW